ncbi:hypothetical protein QTP88_007285 [Uroleucon formosanum]
MIYYLRRLEIHCNSCITDDRMSTRVPLIFIVNELFKSSFEPPDLAHIVPVNSTLNQIEIWQSVQYSKAIIKIIVSCLMFCLSLFLFTLPERYLLPVYRHVVSICVVLVSYWENMQKLGLLSEKYKNFKIETTTQLTIWNADNYIIIFIQLYPRLYMLFHSIILQYCLSLVFDILQVFTTNHSTHKVFRYSFIIPTFIASIPNTNWILRTVIMLSTLLQLFILLKTILLNLFSITNLIRSGYNHAEETINNHGIFVLVETEWNRLKISSVLRMFWAIRLLIQILYLLTNTEIKNLTLFETVKYLLITGCDTWVVVLGMTSIISYFCNNIAAFFRWVLLTDKEDDLDCGVIPAIMFLILTIQTGLTDLDPENRFIKLYEIVHIVCISIQDYIYNMVDKLLTYLNVSLNRSINRHLRALLVCGFLIVLSVTILYLVLSYHSVSHWLLAVAVLNIITIMRILVSLAVYSLLLINFNRSTCWENVDDYVYYINSFGNILEICFCIFLFLNDVYNLVFVTGGVIRTIMICIQTYWKVYFARNEWRKFIKRRAALRKVESLPDATSVELSEFDDVCAICYQKMRTAKITNCNHYFHGECLRKWIYLQID